MATRSDSTPGRTPRQARGEQRRQAIIDAAAAIALTGGLKAVSHREVAKRAGVPLGSTTYYFASLDDLLGAAARVIVERWLMVARRQLAKAAPANGKGRPRKVDPAVAAWVLAKALVPWPTRGEILAHYELLIGTARHPAVAEVMRELRPQITGLIGEFLDHLGYTDHTGADLVLAVVDGAVVSALSEGYRSIGKYAETVLVKVLERTEGRTKKSPNG